MPIEIPVEFTGGFGLTRELLHLLERLDPFQSTGCELRNRLRERIGEQAAFFASEQAAARRLFRGAQEQQALDILREFEQMPLRKALEGLAKTIEEREKQEEYWPEGRLNAGIACELVGDLESAERYLREAVDILSGKGLGREDDLMLA